MEDYPDELRFDPDTFPDDIQAEIDLLIETGQLEAGEIPLDELPGDLGMRIEVHLRRGKSIPDDHDSIALVIPEGALPQKPDPERLH